jgi:hypothetical protein
LEREIIQYGDGKNPSQKEERSLKMLLVNDINPYAYLVVQREFSQHITPPQKKSFTDAYKKTVSAMREQRVQIEAEASEVFAQAVTVPPETVEFPQSETIPTRFRETYEREHVDSYA